MVRVPDPNSLRQRQISSRLERFMRHREAQDRIWDAMAQCETETWSPQAWLTFTRMIAGVTQAELGEALGVSQSTIGKWEQAPVPDERFVEAVRRMVLGAARVGVAAMGHEEEEPERQT